MTPNNESDNYCKNCRAPIGETSSLDPVQTIRDEGFLLRKAASGSPRFIVVLGTWILFVPWIIGTIAGEISIIYNWYGFGSYVLFVVGIALFLVAVKILFTVTKNYLTARDAYQIKQQQRRRHDEKRLLAKSRRQARIKNKFGRTS